MISLLIDKSDQPSKPLQHLAAHLPADPQQEAHDDHDERHKASCPAPKALIVPPVHYAPDVPCLIFPAHLEPVTLPDAMPSDSEELIAGWFHAVRSERRKAARRAAGDDGRYDKLIAAIKARAEVDRREKAREARRADQWAARYAWARENGWDD